jgi:malate dehydrogenase (oxaloacetate-decarboxylating)
MKPGGKPAGQIFTTRMIQDGPKALCLEVRQTGAALLRAPLTNKGTAFTANERRELHLTGLLPSRIESIDEQVARTYDNYLHETTPIGRYQFLRRVQDTNEVLFYALLSAHVREMLPIVYTPTVGEGVERFSDIFEQARGLTLTLNKSEDPKSIIDRYPHDGDVRMIVITDSSAILGIGDQGWNGLAIAIGKLSLYTVAGGVSPFHTLPIVLDVGTDREDLLLRSSTYLGIKEPRVRGDEYLAFVRRTVEAVRGRWPSAIVQWEDFGKDTAFEVLDTFRNEVPSFNDDVQGTGAVALSGLITATKHKGNRLADERFLVFGAGAGGIGVARAIRGGLEREGLSRKEAHQRIFVVDSKGLLVEGRAGMESFKREFAQPATMPANLLHTIQSAKITALLGLSGQPGTFDESVIRAVAGNTDRPIIFALSNPTSSCEAMPSDILRFTNGRAIVATGSPFDPVMIDDVTHVIGQGNNAFIFPGLGFGAIVSGATRITDAMVAESAYALAEITLERYGARGFVYPPVEDLRDVSVRVAVRVAKQAILDGVASPKTKVVDEAHVRELAWSPRYLPFRAVTAD